MQELKINPEFKSLIPALSQEEYAGLEKSIIENGFNADLGKIIVWNDTIVDGHNRYNICQYYNIPFETVNKEFADNNDAKIWIINNQFNRRNLSNYSRGELVNELENILAEKAKDNQRIAGQQGGQIGGRGRDKKNIETENRGLTNLSNPYLDDNDINFNDDNNQPAEKLVNKPIKPINTRKELAKIAGISEGTLDKVKKIKEKASDDVKDKLRTGEISVDKAFKDIKKTERKVELEQQKKDIETGKVKLPDGVFEIIAIDPPWAYGTEYDPNGRRSANPYPEMSLDEIKNIKLPASDNCILFLWTTHKFMRYSFELIDNWGFRDVSIITWVKNKIGLGSWLRSQSEFCIMAVKGKPKVNLTNQTTILNGIAREHSRKPDEFYKMVDELCIGRKLDYFSREKRDGWESFGNDIKKFTGDNIG